MYTTTLLYTTHEPPPFWFCLLHNPPRMPCKALLPVSSSLYLAWKPPGGGGGGGKSEEGAAAYNDLLSTDWEIYLNIMSAIHPPRRTPTTENFCGMVHKTKIFLSFNSLSGSIPPSLIQTYIHYGYIMQKKGRFWLLVLLYYRDAPNPVKEGRTCLGRFSKTQFDTFAITTNITAAKDDSPAAFEANSALAVVRTYPSSSSGYIYSIPESHLSAVASPIRAMMA